MRAQVTVFAALRLDDERVVSSGGGPGMGTSMGRASLAAVHHALRHLGADERNFT
jgi:hypothetical protein